MKILNLKNVMSVLTCLALTLAVAAPSVTYAGDKGKHKGWSKSYKGQGKHHGWSVFHEKQNGSEPSGGEEWTVEIMDLITGEANVMLTVNSLTTVQEVLDTAAGGTASEGNTLWDCFVSPFFNDCTATDTMAPLDTSLTLEASTVE
ncbi:MAG: hypothetical protein P8X93_05440, partial [Gammaproteobacteria bacterium]